MASSRLSVLLTVIIWTVCFLNVPGCLGLSVLSSSRYDNEPLVYRWQQARPQLLRTFTAASGSQLICFSDGTYHLSVSGKAWLHSAPTFFHVGGKTFSTENSSLVLTGHKNNSGVDRLGPWSSVEYWYKAADVTVVTAIKQYDSGTPAFFFEQYFPDGAQGTSMGDPDGLSSGFPGFLIQNSSVDLGYLAYGYIMVGNMGKMIGRFQPGNFTIRDGRNGGPMALFDRSGKDAVFVSPFDQFMTASCLHDKTNERYYWGLMGSVKSLPKDFSMSSVIYHGQGINDAIAGWGSLLRTFYNKQSDYRESDFTNNYLSYWSDNGAYYVNYYVPGGIIQNMTYEEAMLLVKAYSDLMDIPYRSIQYSVWFKQGKFGGNGVWSANPQLFPDGMRYMFEKTGLPATAHSRQWSPDTPYARKNGGKYNFLVEPGISIPYDEQFWVDMFSDSQQYGYKTYMQDWLNVQFDSMKATTENIDVARTWLMQMGEGARKNGLTIQYCMSESRHILQSLEIPVVTQARASNDYQPNKEQWRIGVSSMFAHAVGLAPFKDTFWTTTIQPGNYYKGTEPYPALQVIVATLSTGPVGPGDMVGRTNRTLLMRCCAADGLILKPSRPALAVDNQLLQSVFGGDIGPDGELYTTYSDISSLRFGIIFAAAMNNSFSIGPTVAHFGPKFPTSVAYTASARQPMTFDDSHPVVVDTACSKSDVCLVYTTPILTFRQKPLLLLGELAKIVPMSPDRVTSISWDQRGVDVGLKGASGEEVTFTYIYGGQTTDVTCVMSPAETAVLRIPENTCYHL